MNFRRTATARDWWNCRISWWMKPRNAARRKVTLNLPMSRWKPTQRWAVLLSLTTNILYSGGRRRSRRRGKNPELRDAQRWSSERGYQYGSFPYRGIIQKKYWQQKVLSLCLYRQLFIRIIYNNVRNEASSTRKKTKLIITNKSETMMTKTNMMKSVMMLLAIAGSNYSYAQQATVVVSNTLLHSEWNS